MPSDGRQRRLYVSSMLLKFHVQKALRQSSKVTFLGGWYLH